MRIEPVVPGVYLLFQERRLVYIGKSKDCYGRISEHRTKGRPFDYALVTPCPADDMAWVEASLIEAWGPAQNRQRGGRQQSDPAPQAPLTAPVDPGLSTFTIPKAEDYARRYNLHVQMRAAMTSGELKVYASAPPRANGRAAPRLILQADLRDWCERRQRERFALAS